MNEKIEIKAQGEAKGQGQKPGMAQGHVLDLKLPIGWLLSVYGLGLGVYGLATAKEIYEKSLGVNVNLIWGILMLAVGGGFLLAAFLKRNSKT
jgi:hypothetical protein